jgi:hypothetical protein
MTEPTASSQYVTVEVDRYSGDEQPVTYTQVDDLRITEQGLLSIDHDVTPDSYNRTFYAPGQWAAAQVVGIRPDSLEPKPEPKGPKPNRRRGWADLPGPYDR